jgi:plasmid maintenance system antidote protein VapI
MNQVFRELGISKLELASILEVSPKKANDLILGRREVSEEQAEKLAEVCGVPASTFIEYIEDEL